MNVLENPSFESGWTNLPPVGNNLTNQQPNGWNLVIASPGDKLLNSDDVATGYPEIVHKGWFSNCGWTLPPEERPGGKDPLVLDGDRCLKIFSFADAFYTCLYQIVHGLQPGSPAVFTVPTLVDLHPDRGDIDPWMAEAFISIGTESSWFNAGFLGQRTWRHLELETIVPTSGSLNVCFACKSKWRRPVDFFIDALSLEAQPVAVTPGQPDPPPTDPPPAAGDPVLFARHVIEIFSDGSSRIKSEDFS